MEGMFSDECHEAIYNLLKAKARCPIFMRYWNGSNWIAFQQSYIASEVLNSLIVILDKYYPFNYSYQIHSYGVIESSASISIQIS